MSITNKHSAEGKTPPAEAADIRIGTALAAHRHKGWARVADDIAKLGDQEPLYLLGGMILVGGLCCRNPRLVGTGAIVLANILVADLSKRILKKMVKRTRPAELLERGEYQREVGGSDDRSDQSFPSGHVACTLAAAMAIGKRHPETLPIAMTFTGLVGVARIVKGEHWPADVAAGLLLGVITHSMVSMVLGGGRS